MGQENLLPRHIAIIMDGNGRWAQARKLPRVVGHREGAARVKEVVRACGEMGIRYLTLFAFSSENWTRPRDEVRMLMRYFDEYLDSEVAELHRNNVRLSVIGRERPLSEGLLGKIRKAERITRNNTGLHLILAINYGARQEIIDAVRAFAEDCARGEQKAAELDEAVFATYLCTNGIPDPDLLIRTSGEVRVSNFLLWQLSYTEMYFPPTLWPDFRKKDLELAIKEYQRRRRRFGNIG